MHEMSEKDREWLEWQAYAIAGLILVPRTPLKDRLVQATEAATKAGFSLKDNDEVAKNYVSTWLGKQFEVSSQVIQKRLDKDKLWPPTLLNPAIGRRR
jgi:Zn-dependent peptidase ImmA (M78 family)